MSSAMMFSSASKIGGQRVVGAQLLGDLPRGVGPQALVDVERGELLKFGGGVVVRLLAFLGDHGALTVRWLLTDTYSPSAMETAPPIKPAAPAARMVPLTTPALGLRRSTASTAVRTHCC